MTLTAVVTFTPAPNVSDDITLPTLTVHGIQLDGLSRERLLHETEKHLSEAFGEPVTAQMEEEAHRDSVPVLVASVEGQVVAMGSVQVTRTGTS